MFLPQTIFKRPIRLKQTDRKCWTFQTHPDDQLNLTWDQALFSFLFVNNIPAGILAGLRKRECMKTARTGPDLGLNLTEPDV